MFNIYLMTFNQLSKIKKTKKFHKSRKTGLKSAPQKKGVCTNVTIRSPKKPSSGKRKIARVRLTNGKNITSHIPGLGSHGLTKYSNVLIKGSRVRDIPAIQYRCVRGKLDLQYVYDRLTSRSKYGKKKSDS